jgi:hypothetical protein
MLGASGHQDSACWHGPEHRKERLSYSDTPPSFFSIGSWACQSRDGGLWGGD